MHTAKIINTAQALSAPPPPSIPLPPPPIHTLPSPLPGEIGLSLNDLDAVETESARENVTTSVMSIFVTPVIDSDRCWKN